MTLSESLVIPNSAVVSAISSLKEIGLEMSEYKSMSFFFQNNEITQKGFSPLNIDRTGQHRVCDSSDLLVSTV